MCTTLKLLCYPFLYFAMRNINLKYFLYARKSSESEDRQMASIEDQIAEVKKIAEKHNIQIVDIISESKSAKEPGRLGFNTMLKRIHKGEAQGILTWKLNRLARNPIDGGQISWMLQQNIIKHIQTFERDYNPSDNVLLMQVEFGMANQYVKDLSLDVKRGMRKKAERGWYPITKLPIGYMHKPNYSLGLDDEIIPNPEQFPIVKKLWKLYLTGDYSIADIKRRADSMGLRNKVNRYYSKCTYYRIFMNAFYCGYFNWKDNNNEIVRFKGKHKAMIAPVDFQKTQIMLSKKNNISARHRDYNFPYRGIIKCGECGCFVTPDHKLQAICTKCKQKYSIKTHTACPKCNTELSKMDNPSIIDVLYYHCTKSKGKCSQGSITRKEIDIAITENLKKISINEKIHSWAIKALKNTNGDSEKEELKAIEKLKSKKAKLEERMSGLVELRADREISSEQFNLSRLKIQNEISSVDFEIIQTKRQNIEWFSQKKKDLNFALEALTKFKNGDDYNKNKITRELASNLTLLNKSLDITIRKTLLCIKETSQTTN